MTKTKHPSRGWLSLAEFTEILEREGLVYEISPSDPSMDAAFALASALFHIQKLQELDVETTYFGRDLVTAYLEFAWKDLLFLRRNLPKEILDNDHPSRKITLTKFGRPIDRWQT